MTRQERPASKVPVSSILEGVLERVVFYNDETNYAVARLRAGKGPDLTTIVGSIPSPTPGETLHLAGQWVIDPKFGRQFKVDTCISVLPNTITGIQKYLGSGLVPGVGPEMARRLVDHFGISTLEAIDEGASRLMEVDGIGPVRAESITKAWQDQKHVREIMVFLQGHGVGAAMSIKIFKIYGDRAVSIIKENPYRLAMDINGVGFKTADKVAQNLGIDPASQQRAEAAILHILGERVSDGHVYYPREALLNEVSTLLDLPPEAGDTPARALDSLAGQEHVVLEDCGDHTAVYLKALWVAETNVARRFRTLLDWPKQILHLDVEQAIEEVQHKTGLRLAPMQKESLGKALRGKALVLTGGPGTGKTTLVKSLIGILAGRRQHIVLASPTGRAAKRLSEVTGMEASTIHRLLEYGGQGGFKRNEENPISADILVIDEASMVDTLLLNSLLKAVPRAATVIFVGDVDQLPSVGPGNTLKDLIGSGCIETSRLNEVFRQARQSLITVNAHRINQGQFPQKKALDDSKPDFFFMECEEPEKALDTIKQLCAVRLPRAYPLDPVNDIQVLTPMHKGVVGVANLNSELQALLNASGKQVMHQGRAFRTGDKVMQVRNNYDREIFNGDIGRVAGINFEEQSLQVRFEDKLVDYDWADLDELVLAYAISIHKSQGSEYPAVIVPILTQHYVMLQRNLLYTAITRGKKLVILLGSKRAIYMAIKNDKVQQRYTRLAERLRVGPDGGRLPDGSQRML